MRTPARATRLRYLPAFLGLLIPVATLAWLGSAELGRQRLRAARAMTDHASTVVEGATRELARLVEAHTDIDTDFDAGFEPLVRVDERVCAGVPFARGLVVLDRSGGLIYPTIPPDDPLTVPFAGPDRSAEVRAAEQLIAAEDLEGARGVLEDFLDGAFQRRRGRGRPPFASFRRALFRLGTIQLRLGSLDEAETALDGARRRGRGGQTEPAIALLCDTALAEITSLRDPAAGVDALTEVMRRIAYGEHYLNVGDELLTTTLHHVHSIVERLQAGLPQTDEDRLVSLESYLATDEVRRRGRSFAIEYRDFLRESLRRQIRARDDAPGDTPIYTCHADEGERGASLLVVRRVRDSERESSPMALGVDAAWIGMRFDFESIFQELVAATASDGGGDFYLAIENADGTPLLPREVPSQADVDSIGFEPPRRRSLAGTVLRAEPADPTAFLDAERRSRLTRVLLILALCGIAGGGAWLLVRTAARESEIAAVKMQLVSRVSHELRTPIALIKMYAETIARDTERRGAREGDSEQTLKFTGIIDREADRLAAMVQRILDFSKLGSTDGGDRFQPEPVDLSALITSVTDAYRPRAAARNVEVSASVPRDEAVQVEVDRSACENALLNLLENAVKYSRPLSQAQPSGPDREDPAPVEVSLTQDGTRRVAILTVADRGIGIPAEELDAVFDSFYRATNAQETPGVGLGLHLVRNFARAHGGDIVATRREDGRGTIMSCTLPLLPHTGDRRDPPASR